MTSKKSTVLVTGGAGFIGSHFLELCCLEQPALNFINVDSLTYASHESFNEVLNQFTNYQFIKGDICDSHWVDSIFQKFPIS
ncbi:MAG: GDP-mannose 4,6-dehydratase, partial [Pseudomonadota bacterium]